MRVFFSLPNLPAPFPLPYLELWRNTMGFCPVEMSTGGICLSDREHKPSQDTHGNIILGQLHLTLWCEGTQFYPVGLLGEGNAPS
jgi:hypothetical protein